MRSNRWLGALAAALLASCASYGAPDEVLYGEAVFTQPARDANFGPLATYYLDTTYTEVDGEDRTTLVMPGPVQDLIDDRMQAYGWTPAAIDTADVGLRMTVLKGDVSVYYPGYWCDYWYYYSCYYNWYYAGSYNVGTVILEMGDLSDYTGAPLPPGQQLPVLWTALGYGVATTATLDAQRAVSALNHAFAQSPYLDTN